MQRPARSIRRIRSLPDATEMAQQWKRQPHCCRLTHPARLLMPYRLVEDQVSVSKLQPLVEPSTSALSQHLAVSRQINPATTRCESQTIYYSLAKGPAVGVLDALYAAHFASSRKAELPS